MSPYEAPLQCDVPAEEIVPESYIVFLSQGCSLEKHKETVGDGADLDNAIKYVWDEEASHPLYYSAELDDGSLAAVRADEGVSFVECNRRIHQGSLKMG